MFLLCDHAQATWCGPCKLVAPLMDQVEKEYNGAVKVVKVEHDANPKLIADYKVSVPHTVCPRCIQIS